MTTEHRDTRITAYLRQLETRLEQVPAGPRTAILEDVSAHLDDALEAGRSADEALAALGPVEQVAEQFRTELDLVAPVPPDRAGSAASDRTGPAAQDRARANRAFVLLGWTSVIVALLTSYAIAMLAPVADPWSGGPADGAVAGTAVLCGAAVILSLLPLLVPRRTRLIAAVTVTVVMTALAALAGEGRGLFLVPLVVTMWAATVVPWRVEHGLDLVRAPLWRIFAGVLIALPALLAVAGVMSGSVALGWPAAAAIALFLLLAVLFACGLRWAYSATAAAGLALLVLALVDAGMLFLAAWWAGGMLLVVGSTGIAASTIRRGRGAETGAGGSGGADAAGEGAEHTGVGGAGRGVGAGEGSR
ncbi:DUF1700 domain-containing protein [Leucobacter sp.]